MIVRKASFQQVGGFDSSYWPGEDTKLSRDLVYGLGKETLYAPDVQVFHHRRRLFREHLKQIAGYGFHRGYFSKKFPENSRRPLYFLPSTLVVGLPSILVLGYFDHAMGLLSLIPLIAYGMAIAVGSLIIGLRRRSLRLSLAVFAGAIATHLCYGLYFIKGLLSKKIASEETGYKSNIGYPPSATRFVTRPI